MKRPVDFYVSWALVWKCVLVFLLVNEVFIILCCVLVFRRNERKIFFVVCFQAHSLGNPSSPTYTSRTLTTPTSIKLSISAVDRKKRPSSHHGNSSHKKHKSHKHKKKKKKRHYSDSEDEDDSGDSDDPDFMAWPSSNRRQFVYATYQTLSSDHISSQPSPYTSFLRDCWCLLFQNVFKWTSNPVEKECILCKKSHLVQIFVDIDVPFGWFFFFFFFFFFFVCLFVCFFFSVFLGFIIIIISAISFVSQTKCNLISNGM